MPKTDYLALNALAQEHGILLFSDEVYRELEYDPADRLPSACDINPEAVSLGVMSKAYGLAGLRIGWIATHNAPVLARMAALKDYTTICSSAPSEYLSELALRHREQIAGRNLQIIQDNLSLLDAFFASHADRFEWVRPKAGPIAFPRLSGEDVEQFCHQLVTRYRRSAPAGDDVRPSGQSFPAGVCTQEHARSPGTTGKVPVTPKIMRGLA